MTPNKRAPGKSHRNGISLFQLMRMFPDETSARKWFESIIWEDGVARCHRCGGTNTYEVPSGKPLSHRCRDCRKRVSFRHRTLLEDSHVPLQKWAIAIYLLVTSLKGVSSMKLHRDLDITQKTAWHMLHKIRHALSGSGISMSGTVEVDETCIGELERNKHESDKLKAGRGSVGKGAVVGIKQRDSKRVSDQVIDDTRRTTLHGFITEHATEGANAMTDDFISDRQLDDYKHLNQHVDEFADRHNNRELDTLDQMASVVAGFIGRRLMNRELTNGADGRVH